MSGGVPERPILPSKNKKVAGTASRKENNRGPALRAGGRGKGYTKTFVQKSK